MKLTLKAAELANLMGCSTSAATKLIATMNEELKKEGYLTIRGFVPVRYAYKRLNIKEIITTGDINHEEQN